MIWFNVTNVIQIDGEVSADGLAGGNSGSGGGSGGSIWMHCYRMKGVNIKLDFLDCLVFFFVGLKVIAVKYFFFHLFDQLNSPSILSVCCRCKSSSK